MSELIHGRSEREWAEWALGRTFDVGESDTMLTFCFVAYDPTPHTCSLHVSSGERLTQFPMSMFLEGLIKGAILESLAPPFVHDEYPIPSPVVKYGVGGKNKRLLEWMNGRWIVL